MSTTEDQQREQGERDIENALDRMEAEDRQAADDRRKLELFDELLAACKARVRRLKNTDDRRTGQVRWGVMIGDAHHSLHDSRAAAKREVGRLRLAAVAKAKEIQ